MTTKLEESKFMEQFKADVSYRTMGATSVSTEVFEPLIKCVLLGMADYAKVLANKEEKMAVCIDNLKGDPILSAIISFCPPEDDENDTGNYTIAYTFNKEDLEGITLRKISDSACHSVFDSRAKYLHLNLASPSSIYIAALSFATVLTQWLDSNTSEKEGCTLVYDGFFEASGELIKDKKVFTFTPYGYLKTPIKNDAANQ